MKTSVSLSLFDTPKKVPALFSGSIEENIPYIKDIGYHGVDLFVWDPAEEVSKKAAKLLKQHDLGVGAVMPAALAGQGLVLCHKDPAIREEILKRMVPIMEYAAEVGGMIPLGLVRGSAEEDETEEEALERFTQSVELLLPHAERLGIPLMVEPINIYEINTLTSAIKTADYIKSSGLPLYMMPDIFHMNIEDVSINDALVYCKDYIKHIHFLDSNRGAPGTGHTDMDGVLETLKSIGYDGFLCLEALRRPDGKTVALQGIEYFKRVGLVS